MISGHSRPHTACHRFAAEFYVALPPDLPPDPYPAVLFLTYTGAMVILIAIALALFVPAIVLAGNAGFPDRSLWLSDAKPTVGEQIRLYTVLYNGTDSALSGTLVFLIDGKGENTQEVSLAAQTSSVVSTSWKATAGAHTFGARFSSTSGSSADVQTEAATLSIDVPEPKSELEVKAAEAASTAQEVATGFMPIVKNIAADAFSITEAAREKAIAFIEPYAATAQMNAVSAQSTQNQESQGGGQETKQPLDDSPNFSKIGEGESLVARGTQLAAVGALFAFKNMWLFYPLVALLFFFLLNLARKALRRPGR